MNTEGEGADDEEEHEPRKYYVDGGSVKITSHLVYELDEDGKQLRVIQYTDYTAEKVKTLFSSLDELKDSWANPLKREEIILELQERGIQFDDLVAESGKTDADPLDLLCHIAFNVPLRTRKERAEYLKKNKPDFFDQYGPEARAILTSLLDKYTDHGPKQFSIPDSLQVPPICEYGNVMEIANLFGGALQMKTAVDQLQTLLYSQQ